MAKKNRNDLREEFGEFMEGLGIEISSNGCFPCLNDLEEINKIRDYNKRIIYLEDEINDDTMNVVNDLYRWDREDTMAGIKPEDRTPVIMFVNNYGGDLMVAYALICAMDAYKGKIITINQSVACSAAGLILLCGTKGYRYCTKYSFTLLHQGSSGGGYGTYSQQEASQKNYTKMIGMMEEIVLSHTNIDPKVYKKTCSHENYYYAKDCIDFGICDKVVDSLDEIWKDLKKEDYAISKPKKSTKEKKVNERK